MFTLTSKQGVPAGFILPSGTSGVTVKAMWGKMSLLFNKVPLKVQQTLKNAKTQNVIKTVGWRDGEEWTLVVVMSGKASEADTFNFLQVLENILNGCQELVETYRSLDAYLKEKKERQHVAFLKRDKRRVKLVEQKELEQKYAPPVMPSACEVAFGKGSTGVGGVSSANPFAVLAKEEQEEYPSLPVPAKAMRHVPRVSTKTVEASAPVKAFTPSMWGCGTRCPGAIP